MSLVETRYKFLKEQLAELEAELEQLEMKRITG
jgi:uncharacterized protein YydD (DUF2326 family)